MQHKPTETDDARVQQDPLFAEGSKGSLAWANVSWANPGPGPAVLWQV